MNDQDFAVAAAVFVFISILVVIAADQWKWGLPPVGPGVFKRDPGDEIIPVISVCPQCGGGGIDMDTHRFCACDRGRLLHAPNQHLKDETFVPSEEYANRNVSQEQIEHEKRLLAEHRESSEIVILHMTREEALTACSAIACERVFGRCECEADTGYRCEYCKRMARREKSSRGVWTRACDIYAAGLLRKFTEPEREEEDEWGY